MRSDELYLFVSVEVSFLFTLKFVLLQIPHQAGVLLLLVTPVDASDGQCQNFLHIKN